MSLTKSELRDGLYLVKLRGFRAGIDPFEYVVVAWDSGHEEFAFLGDDMTAMFETVENRVGPIVRRLEIPELEEGVLNVPGDSGSD